MITYAYNAANASACLLIAYEASASPGLCPDKNIIARLYNASTGNNLTPAYGICHQQTLYNQTVPAVAGRGYVSGQPIYGPGCSFFFTSHLDPDQNGCKSIISNNTQGASSILEN